MFNKKLKNKIKCLEAEIEKANTLPIKGIVGVKVDERISKEKKAKLLEKEALSYIGADTPKAIRSLKAGRPIVFKVGDYIIKVSRSNGETRLSASRYISENNPYDWAAPIMWHDAVTIILAHKLGELSANV